MSSSQYVLNNAYRLPPSLAEYCAPEIHEAMLAESRRMRQPEWAREVSTAQRTEYARRCSQKADESKIARAKREYLPHLTNQWRNAADIANAIGCDHATCLRFLKLLLDLDLIEMYRNSNRHCFWRRLDHG